MSMYQAIYPWLSRRQFRLSIPATLSDMRADDVMRGKARDSLIDNMGENITFGPTWRLEAGKDAEDDGVTETSTARKFIQWMEKVVVVFHGPDACMQQKPWNVYHHFHLPWVAPRRPRDDSISYRRNMCQSAGIIPSYLPRRKRRTRHLWPPMPRSTTGMARP